jgi:hypothetical protein
MSTSLLQLELKLLVAHFGQDRVVRELASVTGSTVDDVESRIAKLREQRKRVRKRDVSHTIGPIENACQSNPDCRDLLEILGHAYESRLFLPELRAVNNFLRGNGLPSRQKSRASALKPVMTFLSAQSRAQLESVIASIHDSTPESEFSVLAKELMATSRS